MWQDDWLEPGRRRRIFEGCPSSDQPSCRGKIPDLAGWSMFFGLMARRKWSRVSPPKNRRLSGSANIPRIGWETPDDREIRPSLQLQISRRLFAAFADHVVTDLRTLGEAVHAGLLDGRDMDEDVL